MFLFLFLFLFSLKIVQKTLKQNMLYIYNNLNNN